MSGVVLRLALRELRGGLGGFKIFIACLALGVGAIAAIGSTAEAIRAGLAADGRKMLGGDVALSTIHRDISAAQRRWLEDNAVAARSVTMRSMARTVDGSARALIELKAVDRLYPLYGVLALAPDQAAGAAFARKGGIWGAAVEARLLRRLGIERGARVVIGDATFEVRAVIVHEPDRLDGGGLIGLGPRVMVATDSLPATGLIRPGSLVRYHYKLRLPADVAPAGWRDALGRQFPDSAWRIRDHTNASPAAGRFVQRAEIFMTLIGLTALLIGGVGVGNAVGHYLGGRMATIATLKCIGAASGTIFGIYLFQIAVMAAVGIAAGLAIGIAVPLIAAEAITSALQVTGRFGVYPDVLGLAAAYGILTALVFSVWPLARACQVPGSALFRDLVAGTRVAPRPWAIAATVLAAIALAALVLAAADDRWLAMWFIGGAAAAFALFRLVGFGLERGAAMIGGVRGPTLRLALANLHRPGAPTTKVVLSLGLGLTVLIAVASIESNLRDQVARSLPAQAPDFYFIDLQPAQVAAFEDTVRRIDRSADLMRVPMLRGRITAIDGTPAGRAPIDPGARWLLRGSRGITWSAGPVAGARLLDGEWWPPDYAGPPLISLSAGAAHGLGLGIGDSLSVNVLGREITGRIANIREVRWRSLRINFVMVFSPGVLEGAPQTQLATVRARPAALTGIETAVTDRFANVTAIRVSEVLALVQALLERIAAAVRAAASMTLAAGVLVLAGAAAAGHRRRVYDAVVLKVLGATRARVLKVYTIEYGLLGLATAAVAAVLGTLAAWAATRFVMNIEWVFQPEIVVTTALVSAALTLGFGFVGTWRALGHKAAPLLRNE